MADIASRQPAKRSRSREIGWVQALMAISHSLTTLARRSTPGFDSLGHEERARLLGDIAGVLYGAPLAAAGLVWLVAQTSPAVLQVQWPHLAVLGALALVLEALDFYLVFESRPRHCADSGASLSGLVVWSAALVFGPTALWVGILWWALAPLTRRAHLRAPYTRWNFWRNLALGIALATLPPLAALALYPAWGGVVPLAGLALAQLLPAVYATLVRFGVARLIDLPYFPVFGRLRREVAAAPAGPALGYYAAVALLPHVADPFAILAAGLFATDGPAVYYALLAASVPVSLLAHTLSEMAQSGQRRSRELAALEQLGQALVAAPPDGSGLAGALQAHVPGMFPLWQVAIARFPDETYVHEPAGAPEVPADEWDHVRLMSAARAFARGARLPWGARVPAGEMFVLAPVRNGDDGEAVGGIRLCLHGWPAANAAAAQALLPATQQLAAQIASALHGAEVHRQTLAHERDAQELRLAGQIQSTFLPKSVPVPAGWQLAATLAPAQQASGDFYDFVPLPGERVGVIVADVADKGMRAALYMALSRTLIRTYAPEHPSQPEAVLQEVNRRILSDTRSDQFVTVFYGILDSVTGTCAYSNAGHPPGLVFSRMRNTVQSLGQTGGPLGPSDGEAWRGESVRLIPGDVLLLYSDGLTGAQNPAGESFGSERLVQVVQSCAGRSADEIQAAVRDAVQAFAGDAPLSDDITLVSIVRVRAGLERADAGYAGAGR